VTEVLVDSNILISALIFPNGAVSEALRLAIRTHYIAFTDTIIIEFKRVISIKWPDKTREIEPFLADFQYRLLPPSDYSQVLMRDPDDQPNLNAAMSIMGISTVASPIPTVIARSIPKCAKSTSIACALLISATPISPNNA